MISRRKFFSNAVVTAGAAVLGATTVSAEETEPSQPHDSPQKMNGNAQSDQQDYPPGEPGKDYTPVITPNGSTLPFKVVGGIKVFHLIAEEVDHEFAPGLRAYCCCVLVGVDDPRRRMILSAQSLGEKALGRCCVAFSRQKEVDRRSAGVDSPV